MSFILVINGITDRENYNLKKHLENVFIKSSVPTKVGIQLDTKDELNTIDCVV